MVTPLPDIYGRVSRKTLLQAARKELKDFSELHI